MKSLFALIILFAVAASTHAQQCPGYNPTMTQGDPAAMSVAFAWLYVRTNSSLLLAMLLHAAINNSKDIVPSGVLGGTDTFGFHPSRISWISLALLCASAAYFLNDMRKQTLGNTTKAIST